MGSFWDYSEGTDPYLLSYQEVFQSSKSNYSDCSAESKHSTSTESEDEEEFQKSVDAPRDDFTNIKRKREDDYFCSQESKKLHIIDDESGGRYSAPPSNKGSLLMKKMGYREGDGLGKNAQGRVEPIELSSQIGRQGLGLPSTGTAIQWDSSIEAISVIEPVDWLENDETVILDYKTMAQHWIKEGPTDLDIGSMSEFVDQGILTKILTKKSLFDKLSDGEFMRAVKRSNPYETIDKGIFMNRAAHKMANIDSSFDYMFTEPKHRDNRPMVEKDQLLYFADICAGPGGFSEYILFRKRWKAKGIGFTLKGINDFKLQEFLAGPSETFEPYYGEKGDGNIFEPANINSLKQLVMNVTKGIGVHFVMADGGFSVKGQENIQELLSKQLYLCQFLVALSIVREDGHFVCKLFDLFSNFSAGLIYLMSRAFHRICIFKPNTSRPANSERYLICKHRKKDVSSIRNYLYEINTRLRNLKKNCNFDLNECVPLEILKGNENFFTYLRNSNNRLGNRQIIYLDKVLAYYQNQNLHEPLQNRLRIKCMELWNAPTGARIVDNQISVIETTNFIMESILTNHFKEEQVPLLLNQKGHHLNLRNFKDMFYLSIRDWQCVPLATNQLCFLLGLGKDGVYQWSKSKWERVANVELTAGTMIYGEFMSEFKNEGKRQTKVTTFHIADGFAIGYHSLANYSYEERLAKLCLFAEAINKGHSRRYHPLRVKKPTPLKDISSLFGRIKDQFIIQSKQKETCLFDDNSSELFMQLRGLAIIRTTRDPWRRYQSRQHGCHYYQNVETKQSVFENQLPIEGIASPIDSLKNQVVWMFQAGIGLKGEAKRQDVLHKDEFISYIQKKQLLM